MNSPSLPDIEVTVCFADTHGVWQRQVHVPPAATVADAIEASGFAQAYPHVNVYANGVGVYGVLRHAQFPLRAGDRVEIYRPLVFDPMESRRRRARHKAAAKAAKTAPTSSTRV